MAKRKPESNGQESCIDQEEHRKQAKKSVSFKDFPAEEETAGAAELDREEARWEEYYKGSKKFLQYANHQDHHYRVVGDPYYSGVSYFPSHHGGGYYYPESYRGRSYPPQEYYGGSKESCFSRIPSCSTTHVGICPLPKSDLSHRSSVYHPDGAGAYLTSECSKTKSIATQTDERSGTAQSEKVESTASILDTLDVLDSFFRISGQEEVVFTELKRALEQLPDQGTIGLQKWVDKQIDRSGNILQMAREIILPAVKETIRKSFKDSLELDVIEKALSDLEGFEQQTGEEGVGENATELVTSLQSSNSLTVSDAQQPLGDSDAKSYSYSDDC